MPHGALRISSSLTNRKPKPVTSLYLPSLCSSQFSTLNLSTIPFSIRTNQRRKGRTRTQVRQWKLCNTRHIHTCTEQQKHKQQRCSHTRKSVVTSTWKWLATGRATEDTWGIFSFFHKERREIPMDSGAWRIKTKQSDTSNKACGALRRPKLEATDNKCTYIISCICSFRLRGGVWI